MAVVSTDHIPPQSSKPLAVTFESVTISLVSPRILSMAYPAADAHFFTLVKLEQTLGVASANICEV